MTFGIVTIATGSERYYVMARNLLHSIRVSNPDLKVSLITDKGNHMAEEFDDVIILENPKCSYLDKVDLLINCKYDENIFIDADSLVIGDINYLWDHFRQGTDFSALGERLDIDSPNGWFAKGNVGEFNDRISYVPRMHGGLYYIKKGDYCNKMWELCMYIKENYQKYKFASFSKPADEPIMALAGTVMNATFVERIQDICFFPRVNVKEVNIKTGKIQYEQKGESYNGSIIHFTNKNTEKEIYKKLVKEIDILSHKDEKPFLSLRNNIKYNIFLLKKYIKRS